MGLAVSWRVLLPLLFDLADIWWDEPPRVAWGVCWLYCCYLIIWHHSFLSGGIQFLFLFHGFNFQILDPVFLEDTGKFIIVIIFCWREIVILIMSNLLSHSVYYVPVFYMLGLMTLRTMKLWRHFLGEYMGGRKIWMMDMKQRNPNIRWGFPTKIMSSDLRCGDLQNFFVYYGGGGWKF